MQIKKYTVHKYQLSKKNKTMSFTISIPVGLEYKNNELLTLLNLQNNAINDYILTAGTRLYSSKESIIQHLGLSEEYQARFLSV